MGICLCHQRLEVYVYHALLYRIDADLRPTVHRSLLSMVYSVDMLH